MLDFTIPEGKNTPNVHFSSKEHKLTISGKSYPENARKFYDEIGLNLKNHFYSNSFSIVLDFDYISSASVICVLELLKRLYNYAPSTKFNIAFIYEEGDDDMLAIGENYQRILNIDFNFSTK